MTECEGRKQRPKTTGAFFEVPKQFGIRHRARALKSRAGPPDRIVEFIQGIRRIVDKFLGIRKLNPTKAIDLQKVAAGDFPKCQGIARQRVECIVSTRLHYQQNLDCGGTDRLPAN